MRRLMFVLIMFQLARSLLTECIPGETWFEKCRKCTCKENRKPLCIISACNSIAVCPSKFIWINEKKRCYCDKALQHSVCVDLKFQQEMAGHPCKPDTFMYDLCTMCICQRGKLTCVEYANCSNPKGGICHEGEYIIDNCFQCTCTHTRFRVCTLIEKCWFRETKPGKCPKRKNTSFDLSCIVGIDQECRYDYDCRKEQKCCQVSDCSFRCHNVTIN